MTCLTSPLPTSWPRPPTTVPDARATPGATHHGPRALPLPLPAEVAAPVFAPVNPGAVVDPIALLHGVERDVPDTFALTVRGPGMRDALVNDGDVVLLQRTADVSDGELAAVRVNGHGSTVLRRLYFDREQVRLQPENRRLAPERVDRHDLTIEGRVIAIARQDPRRRPPLTDTSAAAPGDSRA
jgi:SOS-response transcriptional repressor LexA